MNKMVSLYGYEISYVVEDGILKVDFASLAHLPKENQINLIAKIYEYLLREGLILHFFNEK